MGNIGNCHQQPPATIIHWFGEDSIVEITGIGAVNCDQWHVTQIAATFCWWYLQPTGFGQNRFWKDMSDAKFGKGKCAECTRLVNRSEIAYGACCLAKIATRGHHFSFDQITGIAGKVSERL